MSLYSSLTQVLAPYAAKLNGLLTGWNGTTYSTPGEAVRQQIADLHVLIGDEPGTAIDSSAISYGEDSNVSDELDGLNERLGDLSNLSTTAKNNLVAAINEAAESGGSDFELAPVVDANGNMTFINAGITNGNEVSY